MFWNWVSAKVPCYRLQLRFCLRATASGLLAFAIAHSVAFPLHGLWAVLTAVVVTQASLAGSVQATLEYIVGTLGGAVYAAAVGVLVPHSSLAGQAFVLAVAIAPLAFAAALSPSFRVAPFSAVLVLLIGGELGASPVQSALTRVMEVAVGGAVAVAVSLLVLPVRARTLGMSEAARILTQMADVLPRLLAGFTHPVEALEVARLQGEVGKAVSALQALVVQAKRERMVALAADPDPGPLSRALLRIRHDFVILGRGASTPLPEPAAARLAQPLGRIADEAAKFLLASASALHARAGAPALDAVEAAIDAYNVEVQALRSDGLTRSMSTNELERLFSLGFALEQLRHDFSDLARSLREAAGSAET